MPELEVMVPYLMAAGACTVGVAAVGYGIHLRRLIARSQTWPSREGEITRSDIVQTRDHDGDIFFEARIEYRYEVNGRELSGDRVAIGGDVHTTIRGHAQQKIRRYSPGAKILVYFDPADPELACLERTGSGWLLMAGVGAVFAAAGVGYLGVLLGWLS